MRMRYAAPAIALALGLVAAPAHAAPAPGKTTLRGWLGFTTLSLGDINSQIVAQRDAFMADTLVDEALWNEMGGAPSLGLELDVQFTQKVSGGIAVSVHRSSVDHQMFRVFSLDPDTGEPAETESYDERLRVSAWDVVANATMWVPSAPGLHFGAQLGLVRGTFERDDVYHIDTNTILPDLLLTHGTFQGTGVVLGAFTGYEQSLTPQLSLTSRMGYRYRQIQKPLGTTYITDFGDQGNSREWESGPLTDASGRPMSLDLGGFYFQIGLSVTLGGN
jgi:hypothetical protein